MHVHLLNGCAPTPLAHYLKALAVLRLVSEQADPNARGLWRNERFVLLSSLARPELERFFLEQYAPTPLIAPWNGGSGFYPKDRSDELVSIEGSGHVRFQAYRQAIGWGRAAVGHLKERPVKDGKTKLIERCRAEWPEQGLTWLNAVLAVVGEDVRYPALLGTGGNDGRLDFTNNFMQRLMALFLPSGEPLPTALPRLGASLFGEATLGLPSAAVGQFLPGGAGGMNAGPGFVGTSMVNPWDFVLMLEGALAFQVAAVRRLDAAGLAQAAAPFAVRSQAAGFGSAARSEESARGEQWMPLWERPVRWTELQAVFREGRMQDRSSRAQQPIDAAKAIAAHGTSRGLSAFQRYSYIERNGLSNLAVPVGRWAVARNSAGALLDQITRWVDQLRRASRDEGKDPESLRRQLRGIETAMMALASGATSPLRTQDLLVRLGEADAGLVSRPKHTVERYLQPLSNLTWDWAVAADDGSPEFRLALSLATQRVVESSKLRRHVRVHMMPLGDSKSRFEAGPNGLRHDPRVVWTGRNLVDDLCHLARRRLMESERAGMHGLGLIGTTAANIGDVQDFILGRLDAPRIAALARGLVAIDTRGPKPSLHARTANDPVLPSYALIRCALPGIHEDLLKQRSGSGIQIVNRLVSGRGADAAQLACRRLRANGLRPTLNTIAVDKAMAKRLAASLLFPVSTPSLTYLLNAITRKQPSRLDDEPIEGVSQ